MASSSSPPASVVLRVAARARALTFLLAVALTSGGCSAVLGLDDFTEATTDGTGGAASSSGSAASGSTVTGASSSNSSGAAGTASGGGSPASTGTGGEGGSSSDGGGGSSSQGTGGEGGIGGQGTGGGGGSPPLCDGARACVPATPDGWSGPVELYAGPVADPTPPCLGAFPTDGGVFGGDLVPGPFSCDCDCAPAAGIQCTTPANICFGDFTMATCLTVCSGGVALAPNTCTAITTSAPEAKVGNPPPTNMGACNPVTNHVLPSAMFATEAKACGGAVTTPLGCDAGEQCAPRVEDGFDGLCVARVGDVDCPGPFWTVKRVYHQSFEDTRGCSACACGGATSTCGGTIDFTSGDCNGLPVFVDGAAPGSCGVISGSSSYDDARYAPNPQGMCPPQGGAEQGSLSVDGTVTYCCAP